MTLPWREWMTGRVWVLAIAGVAAGTGTILTGAGLMATSGYLISRAALRPPIAELMLVFVAVRFFGLARPALRYLERLASHDATFRLLTSMRGWFVRALLPLSRGQLRDFRSGDLLSRLCSDVDILQEGWLRVGSPALVALSASTITIAALSAFDPVLATTVAALLAFNGLFWSWVASRMDRGLGAARNDERRALASDLVALLQGLPDVLAFGYEDRALAGIHARQQNLDVVDRRYGWRLALHAGVASAVTYLGFLAALVFTIRAAGAGELSLVWIAAVALGVVASFEAVDNLPAAWQFAAQTGESGRRIVEVASLTPGIREVPNARRIQSDASPSIQVEHVTFGYGARTILKEVSFDVAPGDLVGIQGRTGSGKSTLLDLILRASDPQHGTVRVNGYDLREVSIADWYSRLAAMPQQIHVFNTTLRENVRLARRMASDHEVGDALERAQLAEFVASLPEGLETVLGEFGARLSAGERRRLGFARILLTDAPLVLLDEPTEHLDAATERAMILELQRWVAGRTMVLVSHREAPLAIVDRRLLIHDGQLRQV